MKFTLSSAQQYIPFLATFSMLALIWYATSFSSGFGGESGFPLRYSAYIDACMAEDRTTCNFFSYPILYFDIVFLITFPFVVQNILDMIKKNKIWKNLLSLSALILILCGWYNTAHSIKHTLSEERRYGFPLISFQENIECLKSYCSNKENLNGFISSKEECVAHSPCANEIIYPSLIFNILFTILVPILARKIPDYRKGKIQ